MSTLSRALSLVIVGGCCAVASGQGSSAGNFELAIEAPAEIPALTDMVEFDATAVLKSTHQGSVGAQGWTLSIAVDGCDLISATTDGTAGDLVINGGLRVSSSDSFEFTELTTGGGNSGVVSAVVLSFTEEVDLDPNHSPHEVLRMRLNVDAAPQLDDCVPCSLSFVDGLVGSGEPVDNEVTFDESSVAPGADSGTVQVCTRAFGLTFGEPTLVSAGSGSFRFDIPGTLTTNIDGNEGAQGWTVGVVAEDCNIVSVTTDGTVGAEESAGGLRKSGGDGFEFTSLTTGAGNEGAVSAVAFSFSEEVTLDPAGSPHVIVMLGVETVGGCIPCKLAYADGLIPSTEAVDNELTFMEESVRPALTSSKIQICHLGFGLDIEAPAQVKTEVGTVLIDATAVLNHLFAGSDNTVGAQGWSIGVVADDCRILDATTDGTAGDLASNGGFRRDGNDGFEFTELTSGKGNEGVISAIALSFGEDATLPVAGPHTLLAMTVEGRASGSRGDCSPCVLSFRDGLIGSGEPVDNKISLMESSSRPTLGSATVDVCVQDSGQVPGDVNQDNRVDISDPQQVLGFLFLGRPTDLPCGDGTIEHPGNVGLADWNGDGRINIADPVGHLGWLFRGDPAHFLDIRGDGSGCVFLEGCPTVCQ